MVPPGILIEAAAVAAQTSENPMVFLEVIWSGSCLGLSKVLLLKRSAATAMMRGCENCLLVEVLEKEKCCKATH